MTPLEPQPVATTRRPEDPARFRSHMQIMGVAVDFEGTLEAVLPGGRRIPVAMRFVNQRIPGTFGGPVIEMDLDPVAREVHDLPPQPPRPAARPPVHHDMRRRTR